MSKPLNCRTSLALVGALLSAPTWAALPGTARRSAAARRRMDRQVDAMALNT